MRYEPYIGESDIYRVDWIEYLTDPTIKRSALHLWPETPDISDEEEPELPFYVESDRPVRLVSNEEMIQFARLDPDFFQRKVRIISDEEMAEFRKRRF